MRDDELEDVRWFERAEIERAAAEDDDAVGHPGRSGGPLGCRRAWPSPAG